MFVFIDCYILSYLKFTLVHIKQHKLLDIQSKKFKNPCAISKRLEVAKDPSLKIRKSLGKANQGLTCPAGSKKRPMILAIRVTEGVEPGGKL